MLTLLFTLPTTTRLNRRHRGFTINVGNNLGVDSIDFGPGVGLGALGAVSVKIAVECVSRGCFGVVYNIRVRVGCSRHK